MHRIPPVTFLVSLLVLLAACGDDAPDGATSPGTSGSTEAGLGPLVTFAREVAVGDGVRLRQQVHNSLHMTSEGETQTIPMDARAVLVVRCTRVEADGDRVMEMTFEEAVVPGVPEGLEGAKATVRVGPRGEVRSTQFEGAEAGVASALQGVIQSGGFNAFLPLPAQGVRVGQVLDVKRMMSLERLKAMLAGSQALPPGLEPTVEGSYVLKGTRSFDGREAAEFEVDITMGFVEAGGDGQPSVQVRCRGTQYVDLRTGWPAGTSVLRQDMTIDMAGTAMRYEGETRVTAEPLPK